MSHLSPIYACDVLSFLPHSQLQHSRIVSHSLNNTIASHPSRLKARSRLASLIVEVRHANGWAKFGEDGYAEVRSRTDGSWKELQEEWGCCRELKADASSLIGERIVPSLPAGDLVRMSITIGHKQITLCVRNEMTAETAFGVLHILDHIRDAAVGLMGFFKRPDDDDAGIRLNSALFRALSEWERDYKLHVDKYSAVINPTTADQIVSTIANLSIRTLFCRVENLALGLEFALRAKPHCKRLMISYGGEDFFESTLQHFRDTLPAIGRDVVSELLLLPPPPVLRDVWPAGLLPKEEMEALGYDPKVGGDLYRQRCVTNSNSEESFDVMVLYRPPALGMDGYMAEVRIIFRKEKRDWARNSSRWSWNKPAG